MAPNLPLMKSESGGPGSAARRWRSDPVQPHEQHKPPAALELRDGAPHRLQLDPAALHERYAALYDAAPVACFALDHDGLVVEANLAAAGLLGLPQAALVGQPFLRFVPQGAAKAWRRHLRQAWHRAGAQHMELALRQYGGDELQVQFDSLRADDAGGQTLLRLMAVDMTQRRLAQTNRRIAQTAVQTHETERRRLARTLHEELGQPLSALKMAIVQSAEAPTRLDERQRTAAMLDTVDEVIATVRRIAAELGPPMLDDLGVNATIDALVRDTARRRGVHIAQQSDEAEPALSPAASVALYRIVQETLEAIVSRTNAKALSLQLHQAPEEFCLTLTHDGRADAALANQDTAWRGLVHLFGGCVNVGPVARHTSRLEVRLPRDI